MDALLVYSLLKSQLETTVKDAVSRRFEVVESLPEQGEKNVIYLIMNSHNEFDEFIYVDNRWDKIGDTHIDLSDYAKHEDLISKVDVEEGKSLIEESEIERLKTLDNYDDEELRTSVNNLLEEVGELEDRKANISYVQEEIQNEVDRAQLAEDRLENLKQDKLVSGISIKTFNGEPILGEGDIQAVTSVYTYVEELPEEGQEHLIYFTPNEHGTSDEFMWVNNEWHKIGDTDADFTNYVTIQQLMSVQSNLISETENRVNADEGIIAAVNAEAERASGAESVLLAALQNKADKDETTQALEDLGSSLDELSQEVENSKFSLDVDTLQFINGNRTLSVKADHIIDEKTFNNGRGGYRKWSNGHLEQWGVATSSNVGDQNFNLHTPFLNDLYSIHITPREIGNFFACALPATPTAFNMRITASNGSAVAIAYQWHAIGRWK